MAWTPGEGGTAQLTDQANARTATIGPVVFHVVQKGLNIRLGVFFVLFESLSLRAGKPWAVQRESVIFRTFR